MEREGNYVEPTIVTGLPHDSPVVHRSNYIEPLSPGYQMTPCGFTGQTYRTNHCDWSSTRLTWGSQVGLSIPLLPVYTTRLTSGSQVRLRKTNHCIWSIAGLANGLKIRL